MDQSWCIEIKVGSAIISLINLLVHLDRARVLEGSLEKISNINSVGHHIVASMEIFVSIVYMWFFSLDGDKRI